MSKYFSIQKNMENFRSSAFLGKLGNGSLVATKIAANVGIFAGTLIAESMLNNKNISPEQRNKANDLLAKMNKEKD